MARAPRISPDQVRPAVQSGRALLVCAYEDEEKCRRMRLEGALTLQEFRARLPSLPKDQEVVFYCA